VQGEFRATGVRPKFLDAVHAAGIHSRPTCSRTGRSEGRAPVIAIPLLVFAAVLAAVLGGTSSWGRGTTEAAS